MSRLANKPLTVPKGVTVTLLPDAVEVKGPKKTTQVKIIPELDILQDSNTVRVIVKDPKDSLSAKPMLGTVWSLLKNALEGVSTGFKLQLELVGVGYRAAIQGNKLTLTLGFSHPVEFSVHNDVTVEIPSQTQINLSSFDQQLLGQVAAEIRSFRFPECYKGKGVKFAGEVIKIKETKKK